MASSITQNWKAFQYQFGISAHLQYLATGFPDAESARSACPYQAGDGLDLDDRLKAAQPVVTTPDGPQNFHVDIDFSRPGGTGGGNDNPDDLLNSDPAYAWDLQETNEAIDRDRFGNAITNSALDPFAQNVTVPKTSIFYVYKRYESRPNGPLALEFSNSVNESGILLPGFGTIGPGQGRLKTIKPEREFDKTARAVRMIYTFEVREDGFKTRVLDKGRRSFAAIQNQLIIGSLYVKGPGDRAAEPVSDDVLLDGNGAPIDAARYLVTKAGIPPTPTAELPEEVEIVRTDTATFLRHEWATPMPWSALQLRA